MFIKSFIIKKYQEQNEYQREQNELKGWSVDISLLSIDKLEKEKQLNLKKIEDQNSNIEKLNT